MRDYWRTRGPTRRGRRRRRTAGARNSHPREVEHPARPTGWVRYLPWRADRGARWAGGAMAARPGRDCLFLRGDAGPAPNAAGVFIRANARQVELSAPAPRAHADASGQPVISANGGGELVATTRR